MNQYGKRSHEGVLREGAGTADREGFITPSIGALENAIYFTSAPSVTDKAKQVLDEDRLRLPGAVIVWDETVGRRKGSKAIAKSWWAGPGSLTAAFCFPVDARGSQQPLSLIATVVVRAIESFQPDGEVTFRPPNDLFLGGKKVGAVFAESYAGADLTIVRLNCCTDFSKAPTTVAESAGRLIDCIDIRQLPLQKADTLPNTLLTRLMTELPKELGVAK